MATMTTTNTALQLTSKPVLALAGTSTTHVRVLQLSEYKAAALALAEAFKADDVGRYFLDTPARAAWDEAQKWDLHLAIFEYLTYAHIMCGMATAAGEGYGCVALWMPPSAADMDTLLVTLRSGLWRLHYKLCAEGRHRFFTEFFPLLHHTKAAVLGAREPEAYYLVYLGTRESSRGKGLARAVLGHTLARADAEGRPAYLESSNVVNLPFYRRLGFANVKTVKMDRGEREVSLDCMVREPLYVSDGASEGAVGDMVVKRERVDSAVAGFPEVAPLACA